jgi:hypothetical protein
MNSTLTAQKLLTFFVGLSMGKILNLPLILIVTSEQASVVHCFSHQLDELILI